MIVIWLTIIGILQEVSNQSNEQYMQRCLQLAANGLGHTAPNPLVGCVIVHQGKIIGEGYHQRYGEAHAEVNAIRSVANQELLKQSTLYVNLEPCAHHGKTPPCSDLIIDKKIPRVVIGSKDIHSIVSGKGIEKLTNAGVDVKVDVLVNECYELNKRFFTYHKHKRPYIILKWAQTKDGFIDKERNTLDKGINWITGSATKRLVHLWRAQEAAILVGTNTVRNDNPSLTVREVEGENPIRIVIDKNLSLKNDFNIFNRDAKTIVFNSLREEIINPQLSYCKLDFDGTQLSQLLNHLYKQEIQSVIIEGGAFTLNQFITQNLWDEARVLTGNVSFGKGLKAPAISAQQFDQINIGNDSLRTYNNPTAGQPNSTFS